MNECGKLEKRVADGGGNVYGNWLKNGFVGVVSSITQQENVSLRNYIRGILTNFEF